MNAFNKLQQKYSALVKSHKIATAKVGQFEPFEKFAANVFRGSIVAAAPTKKPKKTKRVLHTLWSDLHFGADLLASETGGLDYGRVEEARRMASVVKQISEYKPEHRAETELEILLAGDIIQNMLHDSRDGAPLAEQKARAIHILSQAVGYLATQFKKINVRCTPGNHGRRTSRHKERATYQKWDAEETDIYVAVKYACMNLSNVSFHIPKTPFTTHAALGNKIFTTHGDTVMKPGNPGKTINIKELTHQVNSINAGLTDLDEYQIFAMGHVHTPSIVQLGNGSVIITNGALIPIDQFCTSIGILESQCGQWMWETTSDFAVGDARLIKVGKKQDKQKELDKLIKPWKGF